MILLTMKKTNMQRKSKRGKVDVSSDVVKAGVGKEEATPWMIMTSVTTMI